MTTLVDSPADSDVDHGEHSHSDQPFLAHHFESPQHQFDSCKLGMWLFLITEVLFFSGLFCAYAVYRASHPEIFLAGHLFLDKQMGAINTIVLLFSSLTMAWGVRAAQLGQRKLLIWCLILTLACAGLFLVIKYFEYSSKIRHGVLWASQFDEHAAAEYLADHHAPHHASSEDAHHPEHVGEGGSGEGAESHPAEGAEHAPQEAHDSTVGGAQQSMHDPALPKNLGIFFSIYFALTGLHGIHILAGMGAIGWVLWRAIRGDFGPQYFGPVDFVGLYWHLVDLIWIYLFPLLYLIH